MLEKPKEVRPLTGFLLELTRFELALYDENGAGLGKTEESEIARNDIFSYRLSLYYADGANIGSNITFRRVYAIPLIGTLRETTVALAWPRIADELPAYTEQHSFIIQEAAKLFYQAALTPRHDVQRGNLKINHVFVIEQPKLVLPSSTVYKSPIF